MSELAPAPPVTAAHSTASYACPRPTDSAPTSLRRPWPRLRRASRPQRGDRDRDPAGVAATLGPRHRGGGREPQVHRAEASRLGDYRWVCTPPATIYADTTLRAACGDLAEHPLVYFVDSMLQVDDLDARRSWSPMRRGRQVHQRVRPRRGHARGAGIGFLPCFMADRHDDLVRLLPERIEVQLDYWLVARPEASRRPGSRRSPPSSDLRPARCRTR